MAKEIYADYRQQFLLPPSLEDWIPSDHPVRFIRMFVESLNLNELGFKERESEEGRSNNSDESSTRCSSSAFQYRGRTATLAP